MKILFENEFARSWLDGHSPILYSKVTAIPQKMDDLKRICTIKTESIRSALKNYKRIYAVSDFSEIKIVPAKHMVQFFANFLPSMAGNGIIFKAFIKPVGRAEQAILSEIVDASTSFKAASYDRFEEALSAINKLRQTEAGSDKPFLKKILFW
jgi:hypothetical protein